MAAQHETIVERVRADHREIMERIAGLERRVEDQRDDSLDPVFAPMRMDLLAHMVAEEKFVYNLLEKEMQPWIENSRREHQTIREHLAALTAGGGMPGTAWLNRLREMRQVLESHIAEEERAVLPQLEMKYDLERLRDLGDEFARQEMEAR